MNRTFEQWEAAYLNTKAYNGQLVEDFKALVNGTPWLKEHRDFSERHVYGFGERSFHWLWYLLVRDEMPAHFRFLEVGVYKGQVVSLMRLLAQHTGKTADIYGVTLLSSFGGVTDRFPKFPETDYRGHICDLHEEFDLPFDPDAQLIVGDSISPEIHARVAKMEPFDLVYVDGCHEADYVRNDLEFYGGLVRPGGYLATDDASNNLEMPWGFFGGIQEVSDTVDAVIVPDPRWHHCIAVMHNRIFRRGDA